MRIKRLDGIRAIAIGLVFADHLQLFDHGWIGVDIFFVLSGFLITGILRRERNSEGYWSSFYLRRATRILPPLLLCLALTPFFFSIPWHKLWPYYLFFAANVAEIRFGGQGLSILWSLAVEEQYYLVWPFAVRYLRRSQLIWLLVAVIIIEPLLRAAATPFISFWHIYLLTPFRVDGIAAGSLLAILLENQRTAAVLSNWTAAAFGASLTMLALLLAKNAFDPRRNSIWFNTGAYSLAGFVGFFLIAHVVLHQRDSLTRFLEHPWLVFTGEISYGLYLFHSFAITVVTRLSQTVGFDHIRALMPVTVALAISFSWVSYVYYEKPLIRWGHRRSKVEYPAEQVAASGKVAI